MDDTRAVVHFSGGCDSTLTTALAAERFREIHLLTYHRLGTYRPTACDTMVARLRQAYPNVVFKHSTLRFDKLFREICYENYWRNLRRFGFQLLSVCGLCNTAMHWQTILYCLEHDIGQAFDGSVERSKTFPSQNRTIYLGTLKKLYGRFGMQHDTPVYDMGDQVELELYRSGITPAKKIKLTERDKQPQCIDNLLFTQFVNYYLGRHSWEEYEKDLAVFYEYKLDYVGRRIEERRRAG